MNRASSSSVGSRLADMSCRLTSETCSGLRVLLTNSRVGRVVTAVDAIGCPSSCGRKGRPNLRGQLRVLGPRVGRVEPERVAPERLGQDHEVAVTRLDEALFPPDDLAAALLRSRGELVHR